jgi:hypothetical protein
MTRKKRFQTEAQSLTLNDKFEGWSKKVADLLKDVEIPNYNVPLNNENTMSVNFKQFSYVTQVSELIFQHNKERFKTTAEVYRNAHILGTAIQYYIYFMDGRNSFEKQLLKVFKDMEEVLSYSATLEMAQKRIKILIDNLHLRIMDEDDIFTKMDQIVDSCPVKIQPPLEQFIKDTIYQSKSRDLLYSYNVSKRHLKPV